MTVGYAGVPSIAATDAEVAAGYAPLATRARSVTDVHTIVQFSNDSNENTICTLALPTNVAAGDELRFRIGGDILSNASGAVTYTFKIKVGGTTVLTSNALSLSNVANRRNLFIDGSLLVVTPASDSRLMASVLVGPTNANTLGLGTAGGTGCGASTSAIAEDLTSAKNLTVTCQMGTADTNADIRIHLATLAIFTR